MKSAWILSVAALFFAVAVSSADDAVPVKGSNVKYPVAITATLGDQKYSQKLTGVAMRKKAFVDVYAIGSYVANDFKGKTPEELASADVIKQLHLVMERNVSGSDMAKAFETAIRANYGSEFDNDLAKLTGLIAQYDLNKGDQVWITHVPGYGLHFNLVGKRQEFIPGLKFAKAVWDIYLGPKNVGEAVKKGLTSRL
ncbi:MAG: chalcone isomerase family protein [Gemmataceae bacterium]|nr:chalcone isomerase family protein [Gemmataceae bacterium]